jgi:hypothetical protein
LELFRRRGLSQVFFKTWKGGKAERTKLTFSPQSRPTVFERISILKRTERQKGRKKERFSVIILCRKTGKLEIKKFEIK